ncbi:MAG TPA: nitronate monooxygenase [Puia sp.]|nr:nitronate monooxygenase [Puia sp.]
MWYDTRATRILGIRYPIFQGPFGGTFSTIKLTSIVSNMGGLGGYGAYTLSPDEIVTLNKDIRQATDQPYNINLWVSHSDVPQGGLTDDQFQRAKQRFQPYFDQLGLPFPDKPAKLFCPFEDQVQAILDARPPVFSFVFGIPSPDILDQCRKKGILTAGAATTLDEALALEAAGVDMIIASGFEGGGHRPSFLSSPETSLTGTFVLVQQIRDKVRSPVIAAGGVASARGVAAAIALGADAVQVGTAFLACEESGAPAFHRELLFSDAARYTTLTRAFTGRLGRGLVNTITRDTAGHDRDLLPFPLQSSLMSRLRQAAIAKENWEMVLLWGGQIATVLTHTKTAELMDALVNGTTAYFATNP